ncbi:hypothetical protein C8R43DRAFT_1170481, partial [Mycena crocata]
MSNPPQPDCDTPALVDLGNDSAAGLPMADDTDRLVGAIQQLCHTTGEHSETLKTTLERLNIVIESLTPKPQTDDKKTVFWTAYKALADEFDKEFLRKYGNDLDTSLIFVCARNFPSCLLSLTIQIEAGLFSAVSSAFIIQIQPELLSAPPTIIVVAQSFLYFSLFSTLGAALLAVLGKQWLLHYDSVGEKGTIEERGLERQRKFDGLRTWKFDVVMQMFPLLIQFSVLLFALALSIYLWTIHRAIAGII